MKIIIHKGTKEIGGTCIQLSTEKTTLLVDIGMPLSKKSTHIDYNKIKTDAILISHPHQDHYGLINTIDTSTPIYIGDVGKHLINATLMFLGKELHLNNFHSIKRDIPFVIGDFTITPYLVDHSAVDAFSFLIQSNDANIFYSGDFRAHGRKSVLFQRIIENPPANIDILFLEGTMINRNNDEFSDEQSVEDKITSTIKDQNNISFIISSSQNIDRIVSAYRSCLKSGKIFVIDLYTAWVLEQLKIVSNSVPSIGWDNIKIYADYKHDLVLKKNESLTGDFRKRAYKYRIKKEEIIENPSAYLYLAKMSKFKLIESFKDSNNSPVNVIYSQWLGYLNRNNEDYYGSEQISAFQKDHQVNFIYAHTSGHAIIDDLKIFAEAFNPKITVPIHTEYKNNYTDHFNHVKILNDGEILNIELHEVK